MESKLNQLAERAAKIITDAEETLRAEGVVMEIKIERLSWERTRASKWALHVQRGNEIKPLLECKAVVFIPMCSEIPYFVRHAILACRKAEVAFDEILTNVEQDFASQREAYARGEGSA